MPHLYVILVLISISLAGGGEAIGLDAAGGGSALATVAALPRLLIVLSGFASIAVAGWAFNSLCVRAIDRRGRVGAVRWSGRIIAWTRLASLGWHLASVYVLGLLGIVREGVGDLVLVDELLAAAPAFAVLLWTYRIAYPIERRLREAMLMRTLDEGGAVYSFPSSVGYVLSAARNNLAIMLVPLVLILGWSEALDRLLDAFGWFGQASGQGQTQGQESVLATAAPPAIRLAGSIAVFALIPPLMTRVWDTVPIPDGELREGLERLARTHRVRLRRFLIWRTGGAMLNGAVIGLTPWLRYIVLTDALLDSLREKEVEAVAAHEVAHVKKRHMVWLALAVLGSAMFFGEGGAILMELAGWPMSVVVWGSAAGSLVAVLLVLGAVSRRFEWQADAFAARHLSGPDAGHVTEEAAGAMSMALARVSRLNGMPEKRFTWRHGSIATRRKKLAGLVGQRTDRLPIDRRVRVVLLLTLLAFLAGLWLTVAGFVGLWPYTPA